MPEKKKEKIIIINFTAPGVSFPQTECTRT